MGAREIRSSTWSLDKTSSPQREKLASSRTEGDGKEVRVCRWRRLTIYTPFLFISNELLLLTIQPEVLGVANAANFAVVEKR